MIEWIATILIFVAVIAITAVLFGGWLILAILNLLGRLLFAPLRKGGAPESTLVLPPGETMTTIRCPNDRCRAENPAIASYCRRCGSPARAAVQHVQPRRVAMW
jgi:hypothetical protein